MLFNPDLFSNYIPKWQRIERGNKNVLIDIVKQIPDKYISEVSEVFSPGTFELNSSNFKIKSTEGKSIVLKKWPKESDINKVEKTQKLINWLKEKNIPVAESGKFINNKHTFFYDNSVWSFNFFCYGNYFTGLNGEIISAAKATGELSKILLDIPLELIPEIGPEHLSSSDDEIFKETHKERNNWMKLFGTDTKNTLNSHWEYIYETWQDLRKNKISCGPIAACHFDMHPHNLIVQNEKIAAILDFDSCKRIPLGYSLAFNSLKQVRQFISLTNQNKPPKEIMGEYLNNLTSSISFPEVKEYDFLSLSKAEIMRRICFILKSNLRENNSNWNHVLPIQISHLFEADSMFKI